MRITFMLSTTKTSTLCEESCGQHFLLSSDDVGSGCWLDLSEYQSFSNIISSKFCSPSRLHIMLVGHHSVHSKEIHSKEREGESTSLAR